jgi:hypothetical protein
MISGSGFAGPGMTPVGLLRHSRHLPTDSSMEPPPLGGVPGGRRASLNLFVDVSKPPASHS